MIEMKSKVLIVEKVIRVCVEIYVNEVLLNGNFRCFCKW